MCPGVPGRIVEETVRSTTGLMREDGVLPAGQPAVEGVA
jgi:hypothetical protein